MSQIDFIFLIASVILFGCVDENGGNRRPSPPTDWQNPSLSPEEQGSITNEYFEIVRGGGPIEIGEWNRRIPRNTYQTNGFGFIAESAFVIKGEMISRDVLESIRSRGDLQWARIEGDVTSDQLTLLAKLPLRGLCFYGTKMQQLDLASLAAFQELKWLAICECGGLENAFKTLPVCRSVRVLLLEGSLVGDTSLLLACRALPELNCMNLDRSLVTDNAVAEAIDLIPSIEWISVYACPKVTANVLERVSSAKKLKQICIAASGVMRDEAEIRIPLATLLTKHPKCSISFVD